MRRTFLVGVVCMCLSGCVSRESREAYDRARAELVDIQQRVEADRVVNGRESQMLISQLKDAETKLATAKHDMTASRGPETASTILGWVTTLGPLLGMAYPPAMTVLGPLQGALAGWASARKPVSPVKAVA